MTTIGRLRELELLGRVVAAAEAGAGGVALVEGDAGIGKTHVLDALAVRATGSLVVRGRAWEEGGAPPSWPWREVLQALNVAISWDETPDRFVVYQQVIAALRAVAAARPLLVLLDDLHAADADTLALTRLVARSIGDGPVAVVIGARPSERLTSLARECVHVTLGPLSAEETTALADLVAEYPLNRRIRDDIIRIAEGSPLVIQELALAADRAGSTGGRLPQQLRGAVLERVASLSGPAREVLEAAAVLGKQFDLADVAGLIDRPLDEVLDRLRVPSEARIVIAATGGGWQFSHQVLRDAIYESTLAPTRLALHAAAQGIAARHSDERLDEHARHVIAAVPLVDRDHALHVAMRAAAQASRSLAHGAAADTLGSALALTEDPVARLAVLLELGDEQLRAGRVAEAWDTFDQASALAHATNDADASTRALLGRTERVPSTSHANELAGVIEHALTESRGQRSPARTRLLGRYARLLAAGGAPALASQAAAEALAAARTFDDDVVLSEILTVRHVTLGGPDDLFAAKEVSDELVDVAARSNDQERILEAEMAQLIDHLRLGDIAGVDRTLERYRQVAGATGVPRHRFFLESRRGMRAFLAGRLAEGEAMLDRAYRIGLDIEEPDAEAVFHGARVMVLADLVDPSDLLAEATFTEAVAAATGETRLLVFAAYVRSSAGEREAAARLLDQALVADFSNVARDGSWLMFMCMAAYVVSRSPAVTRVQSLYDQLLPYRGRVVVNDGAVTFGGVVDHYLGLLAGSLQQPDTANAHFDDAITAYQRLGATLFLARASQHRHELGSTAPATPPPAVRRAMLRRSRGEWECGYADAAFHVTHMVGLQHLVRLVAAVGSEVHVLDLASPGADRGKARESPQAILDPQAKAAYRERIAGHREDLEEAESNNDYERADHLRVELDAIVEELRGAVGLGGRDRTAATNTERARVAVRKAITTALDRLGEHDTAFAQHLRIHVQTGIYCRYQADPTHPIDWDASP